MYFYTVGNMLGVDKIHKWSREARPGAARAASTCRTRVESIVPSTEWKQQRTGERWYPGETISVAIGQGQVSVTPMSMAVMMATVANGGTRVVPRLVKAVRRRQGLGAGHAAAVSPFKPFLMKPETVAAVHDGLWMAVNGAGTGRPRAHRRPRRRRQDRHRAGDFELRARSARAAADQDLRDHGWFVFLVPRTIRRSPASCSPSTASTATSAAPIAKHIIETYLRAEGRPAAAGPAAVPGTPGTRRRRRRPARAAAAAGDAGGAGQR